MIVVAVLEDSEPVRNTLRLKLEDRKFLVLTLEGKADCLELARAGCRTFVLDIELNETDRKVEGLETLEAIKLEFPTAFCAIITNRQQYREIASKNLRADWFSGKSSDEMDGLIERIEQDFLDRLRESSRSSADEVRKSAFEMGSMARAVRRRLAWGHLAKGRILASANALLQAGPAKNGSTVEDRLALLEPDFRQLLSFRSEIGEGYGILITALWNALLNLAGEVNEGQVALWGDVFERALESPPQVEEALALVDLLEDAGFNPDAPGLGDLLNVLASHEDPEE